MDDAAGAISAHYERHAASWDADRRAGAWSDKPHIRRFVDQLPPGATVLDLGCGGGVPVAAHLAATGVSVTGVDSSPTLIALCRSRMPTQEWIVADMRTLALGRRFHGILAWDSFFHLAHDDQRRMFAIFAAHCTTNGVLMFNAGPAHGESVGAYRGDPLYHASLDADEYRILLTTAGFEPIAHSMGDPATGDRTSWLARMI